MTRTRWLGVAALLLAGLLVRPAHGAPAAAKESPLAHVPAQAPIVIQVRGVEHTKARLLALVKNAVPDLADTVKEHIDEALKEGFQGRKLEGIAPQGPIFIAFTEMPKPGESTPSVALIARVTDYKAFQSGLLTEDERKELKKEGGYETGNIMGQETYFLHQHGYAVVTPSKAVAEQMTKQQPGLDTRLHASFARRLLESDAALYVDMAAVNKEYGDKIRGFQQVVNLLMGQAASAGGEANKANVEMAKKMIAGAFQLAEDSKALLATIDLRPEGVALHGQNLVTANTPTSTLLKGTSPAALNDLGKLPAGELGYFTMKGEPSLMESLRPFLYNALGGGQEANKEIKEGLDLTEQAGMEVLYGSFSVPVAGLSVSRFKDPEKAVQGQIKMTEAMKPGSTYQTVMLKEKPEVKRNARTYHGYKLNRVTMKFDFEKLAAAAGPGGADAAEVMKKMYGGDEIKSWFGTDGKEVVTVTAKNWDDAKKLLDEFVQGKDAVGSKPAFRETRRQLPEQATMLGLMDLPRYAAVIAEFVGPALKAQGLPVDIPKLSAEPGKSYVGFALTLRPERGSGDLWVPASAIRQIRKMVEQVQGGGNNQ